MLPVFKFPRCFAASRNEEVEPVCFQSTQQRYDFEVSCETPGSKIKEAFEEVRTIMSLRIDG